MSLKELKKYEITCNICDKIAYVEQADNIFKEVLRPEGWVRIRYRIPRAAPRGSCGLNLNFYREIDTCPDCVGEEEIPEGGRVIDIREY